MEYLHLTCELGHRLKAGVHLSGRTLACPKCKRSVVVPQRRDTLSDTGVMRILGDVDPLPAPPVLRPNEDSERRNCPRCECQIDAERSVCPYCDCYVGSMSGSAGILS